MARGLSNLNATALSAPLHGASTTCVPRGLKATLNTGPPWVTSTKSGAITRSSPSGPSTKSGARTRSRPSALPLATRHGAHGLPALLASQSLAPWSCGCGCGRAGFGTAFAFLPRYRWPASSFHTRLVITALPFRRHAERYCGRGLRSGCEEARRRRAPRSAAPRTLSLALAAVCMQVSLRGVRSNRSFAVERCVGRESRRPQAA